MLSALTKVKVMPFKKSMVEARYVRRNPNYISAYVSSHNGCSMGCKFCWLTATGQTDFNHVDIQTYVDQMNHVLAHGKQIDGDNSKSVRVNINMMARGEALANKNIIKKYDEFYNTLNKQITDTYGYKEMKVNLSTIMPTVVQPYDLYDIFKDKPVNIYYSIYSVDNDFRKKWIPNAMDWKVALDKLKKFQDKTHNTVAFHFALIKGENDNLDNIKRLADEINKMDFEKTKFNLVRFNPHPSLEYKESDESQVQKIYEILKNIAKDHDIKTNKTRVVPRIGYDARVSCGMFVTEDELFNLD